MEKINMEEIPSPSPLLPTEQATGKFTLRHLKYSGLAIIILSPVLFYRGDMISIPYSVGIGWVLGGLGLALYAKGGGRSFFWGLFLGLGLPIYGPLICLFVFAKDIKRDAGTGKSEATAEQKEVKKTSKMTIVAILGAICFMFGGTALYGFFYNDYAARARVSGAVSLGESASKAVEEYYAIHGKFPATLKIAGFTEAPPSYLSLAINPDTGEILATYLLSSDQRTSTRLDGKSLKITPSPNADDTINWKCSSNEIAKKFLPLRCQ